MAEMLAGLKEGSISRLLVHAAYLIARDSIYVDEAMKKGTMTRNSKNNTVENDLRFLRKEFSELVKDELRLKRILELEEHELAVALRSVREILPHV